MKVSAFETPIQDWSKRQYLIVSVGLFTSTARVEHVAMTEEEIDSEIEDFADCNGVHSLNVGESYSLGGSPTDFVIRIA